MRVLVAPDKFRGTLTAAEAAAAIERGWRRGRPRDRIATLPMADGGEGTLEAIASALGGDIARASVSGPLGDPVTAEFALVETSDGPTAVVEMARASGLALVPPGERDPLRASTRGTGELIREAVERYRPATVLVCIGGSATTDGGAGMAQALGARLLDERGGPIGAGGAALLTLARIDITAVTPRIARTRFVVACDVDNPLVGPAGAAAVYGPQKGATPSDVVLLDRALAHYAAIVARDLGLDLRELPGAGAAGGLGAGLVAFTGARMRPGVEVVMEAVGFFDRLRDSDLVLTGEGRFDEQSLHGKTVAGVTRVAADASVAVAILCGRADVRPEGVTVASLVDRFGEREALERAGPRLELLAEEFAGAASDRLVPADR
jgi:glycerate 2-kinase